MSTTFAEHLLDGNHASRPAATAVPDGTLYSCSTHSLVYQSDGAAWATWASLVAVASQLVVQNEFRNFPSIEGANDTQPEWWEEEAASTAVLTEVDVVGEGITETYERCFKIVTTADDYAYQLFTYADEPRLKAGRTVSVRVAVWAVAGVTARTRIQSSVGSLGVDSSTAAAWDVQTVDGVVLDGTTVEVRLEVNNGTAYFVPLAFGIGASAASDLASRGLRYRASATRPLLEDLNASTGKAFADVDLTSNTSPLAVLAALKLFLNDGGAGEAYYYQTRPNGSSLGFEPTIRGRIEDANIEWGVHCFQEILDDNQIIETALVRDVGAGNCAQCRLYLDGWWEWE